MTDVRLGARFRALRVRLRWRQADLAARAGVSQGVISLVERGRIEEVTIGKLRAIARQLDAEFTTGLWWRGGDLDRLVDEAHATLVGAVVDLLRKLGWQVRVEVSYAVYRERGSIDVVAWHEEVRALLIVEVKSDLLSVEETLRKHDEKARLGPRIAREQFGWPASVVHRLLVLPSLSTQRRRVERQASVLEVAYPQRGHELQRWLAAPASATTGGILFLPPTMAWGVARRSGSG